MVYPPPKKKTLKKQLYKNVGHPRGVIKVQNCGLYESEFELSLRYYAHFRTNTKVTLRTLLREVPVV